MKQLKLWMFAAILCLCGAATFTSCTNDDEPIVTDEPVVTKARVTAIYHIDEAKTTVINMEYPSVDPFGKPAMLSGTITFGDEVTKEAPARGLLLYNHFTVYRADQCPTMGDLKVEALMSGSGLITISSDYYGFGSTADKLQAYCIPSANAQASVDALLAAKELLTSLGYSWNDAILFNAGYSEGGQTAMAVVRLIDEKYPDLHLTYTFAGGGPHDIPETYRQFIESDVTGMPSTVINVLLAYNEYFQLGIPRSDIFMEPVLSNIDEWVVSKKYTREEIDAFVGTLSMSKFATPAMLDLESSISKKFMAALENGNLCKGWTPRKDENIILVHHTEDITVPVENTQNLYAFLKEQGVENVRLYVGDFGTLGNNPAHESGAIMFAGTALATVCEILDIDLWFNIFDLL